MSTLAIWNLKYSNSYNSARASAQVLITYTVIESQEAKISVVW